MRVVVQKYGGSSVADLQKIRRVAERVAATRATGAAVCVVVSAMGTTTNELIALAKGVAASPDRRELDMLVSVGERITMALLAMALKDRGVPARSLTGSQSGIVTDESHADAKVVEVRPDRLREVLASGEVAIVAGFQGVSRAREVTTLGRGGSDTTAVVLAAALGAEHAEILSDVDGVWSADPRVVPEAVKLDALGLHEALALARGGAKVLFEDAVRYARDHGVTIVAGSTFGPGAGSRLAPTVTEARRVVGVTGDRELARVTTAPDDTAAAAALVAAGARARWRVGDAVWVDLRNAHGGLPPGLPAVRTAMVTAAGSAVGEQPPLLAAGTAALRAIGVAPTFVGATQDQLAWEVPADRLDEAVRAVHAALVGGPARPG
jgi:aspartate kinase